MGGTVRAGMGARAVGVARQGPGQAGLPAARNKDAAAGR